MSALETAKQQIAEGNHKKAVNTLWMAEAQSRTSSYDIDALIETAATLRAQTTGRVQRDCELLLQTLRGRAAALEQRDLATSYRRDALAVVQRCRVLGGHGLPPRVGEIWELVFTDDEIRLVDMALGETAVPLSDVTAIEIGGPGAKKQGGGFIGGGFGLGGAAEGMLIASALNMLTTRTSIDTVICIQTKTAELFLHHGEATPDALRMQLSPAFTVLRQRLAGGSEAHRSEPGETGAVEQLTKLAELLDRGLIDEEEFRSLKADIFK
jgi:hypothetical protein